MRREIPEVVIRTSLIVGFPGETEEQFEELVQFIQNYPLDNVGIFKFSREPGSHAYSLPDQIPEEVKITLSSSDASAEKSGEKTAKENDWKKIFCFRRGLSS